MTPAWTPGATSVAFALAYVVALAVGRLTAVDASTVGLVHPAAGVAAVWFVVQGLRPRARRVVVLDHVLLVGIGVGVAGVEGMPVVTAVGLTLATVLRVHVFAALLRRWAPSLVTPAGTWELRRPGQIGPVLAAALVASVVATCVSWPAVWIGSGQTWPDTVLLLVTRSTAGIALTALVALRVPGLVADVRAWRARRRSGAAARHWAAAELGLAVVTSAALSTAVFGVLHQPLAFTVLAVTAWVAVRFRTSVAVVHDAAVGVVVLVATVQGVGVFSAVHTPVTQALVAQLFVVLLHVLGLALATGRDERVALAERLRGAAADAERTTGRVRDLAAAVADVTQAADPRAEVCAAACRLTGADSAFLVEPDGSGDLVSTGECGWDVPIRLPMTDESLSLRVYLSGTGEFVPDVTRHPHVAPVMSEALGPASALWEPVQARGGVTVAVLVVVWRTPRAALAPEDVATLHALGAGASHAVERADLLAQLEVAAERDVLTGLANRRRWDHLAATEIARAHRAGTPLSFALVDLDHFKAYNDGRGHLAGDALLVDFSRLLVQCLRETDVVARWGGEEFALALPGCSATDAAQLARRVQAVVPQGQTCTVGIAEWRPGLSVADALARADEALYRGKKGGRDLIAVHGRALPGVIPSPPPGRAG